MTPLANLTTLPSADTTSNEGTLTATSQTDDDDSLSETGRVSEMSADVQSLNLGPRQREASHSSFSTSSMDESGDCVAIGTLVENMQTARHRGQEKQSASQLHNQSDQPAPRQNPQDHSVSQTHTDSGHTSAAARIAEQAAARFAVKDQSRHRYARKNLFSAECKICQQPNRLACVKQQVLMRNKALGRVA